MILNKKTRRFQNKLSRSGYAWVRLKIVVFCICFFTSLSTAGIAREALYSGVINAKKLNIRENPGRTANIVFVVDKNTRVNVIGEAKGTNAWLEVEYKGVLGYVRNREKYICLEPLNQTGKLPDEQILGKKPSAQQHSLDNGKKESEQKIVPQENLTLSYTRMPLPGTEEKPQAVLTVSHMDSTFWERNQKTNKPDIVRLYRALFKQAMETSPEIQVAGTVLKLREAQRKTARAKVSFPTVDFEAFQKQRFNHDTSSTSPEGDHPTEWGVDLEFPVYKMPEKLALDIATMSYEVAAHEVSLQTGRLDVQLRELMGNYMVVCYNLLNMENTITLSKDHVAQIQRGYELKDQTKLALLKARTHLEELETRRELIIQRREDALKALQDYTGLDRDDPIVFGLNGLMSSEMVAVQCIRDFADVDAGYMKLAEFLKNSDDKQMQHLFVNHSLLYKKIHMERQLAHLKARQYSQNEWPELTIQGEWEKKTDTRFEDFDSQGSVSLVLNVPLFSGGTRSSNLKAQSMAKQAASIQERADIRKSYNSIVNQYQSIHTLHQIRGKQQSHMKKQQEIVELSLKSYKIKQISMQDLLTSKNRLIDAKDQFMQTTMDIGTSMRRFAWEIGKPFAVPVFDDPLP